MRKPLYGMISVPIILPFCSDSLRTFLTCRTNTLKKRKPRTRRKLPELFLTWSLDQGAIRNISLRLCELFYPLKSTPKITSKRTQISGILPESQTIAGDLGLRRSISNW